MNPRIIRQCFVIGQYDRYSGEEIEKMCIDLNEKCIKIAKKNNYQSIHTSSFWSIVCAPLEYPMYLLGPNSKQIKTCNDALTTGYPAEYTVIIRESL